MNILLYGAASYLGYHLCVELATRGIPFVPIEYSSNETIPTLYKSRRIWHLLLAYDIQVISRESCDDGTLLRQEFSHLIYLGNDMACLQYLFTEVAASANKATIVYDSQAMTAAALAKEMNAQSGVSSLGLTLEPASFSLGTWPHANQEPHNSFNLALTNSSAARELSVTLVRDTTKALIDKVGTLSPRGAGVLNITTEHYIIRPMEMLKRASRMRRGRGGWMGKTGLSAHPKLMNAVRQYLAWSKAFGSQPHEFPCAAECSSSQTCLRTGFDDIIMETRRLTRSCNVVFYTVALHKELASLNMVEREGEEKGGEGACYLALVKKDSPIGKQVLERLHGWYLVRVPSQGSESLHGARRMSRIPKITPRRFFSTSVQYAVYFDSTLTPLVKPSAVGSLMVGEKRKERVAIAMHAHHLNMRTGLVRTPMEEIQKVLDTYGSSERTMLARQSRAYQKASLRMGHSYRAMPVASFIIHDLHAIVGHKLRCAWLNEYLLWADRDQPPLYFVLANFFRSKSEGKSRTLLDLGNEEYLKVFNNTSGCKDCEVHYRPFFVQTGVKGYSIESRNDG